MTRLSLILCCVFLSINTAKANCAFNDDVLAAKYKVTNTQLDRKKDDFFHLILWRNGKQVAHEYSEKDITEIWELTPKGMLRMVLNFDDHKRGIEYQPNEINEGHGERDWSLKNQLISDSLIKSMQLESTQGADCEKTETYTITNNDKTISLEWLVNQRLIKTYQEKSSSENLTWELEKTTSDPVKVKQFFNTKYSYQTTDYTDIGDNESDPFLIKMINLGFIAHGHSGFYDSQGNSLGENHQH